MIAINVSALNHTLNAGHELLGSYPMHMQFVLTLAQHPRHAILKGLNGTLRLIVTKLAVTEVGIFSTVTYTYCGLVCVMRGDVLYDRVRPTFHPLQCDSL